MHFLTCIIIAKNQANTIIRCLDTVQTSLRSNDIKNFEIIYIDSSSSDNSIDNVQSAFGESVAVYRISGVMNAGIARNMGATLAKGDTLFFADGDMDIDIHFFKQVYSDAGGLRFDAVSGKLEEIFYDSSGKQIGHCEDRYRVTEPTFTCDLGGVFFIRSELFQNVNGFKSYLKENEDIDFVFRLIKNGNRFLRLPYRIATHHTIDYHSYSRLFMRFFGGNHLYDGVMYRENFTSKHCIYTMLSHQKFLAILIIAAFLTFLVHYEFAGMYPIAVFFKFVKNRREGYLATLLATFLRDISGFAGFLFFFPARISTNATRCERL